MTALAPRTREIRKRLTNADPATLERLLLLLEPAAKPDTVKTAEDSVAHLRPLLAGQEQEHLVVLFLNRRLHVLAVEVLSKGTTGATFVDPRCIFRRALLVGADSIILAHNHPSGDPEPSREDIASTKRVMEAGELLGISVIDHLVITDTRYVSLAQRGLMFPSLSTSRGF